MTLFMLTGSSKKMGWRNFGANLGPFWCRFGADLVHLPWAAPQFPSLLPVPLCTYLSALLVQIWCNFGASLVHLLHMGFDDNTAAPNFPSMLPVPFGIKTQFWCNFVNFWCNFGATFGNFRCIFGSLTLDFDQNTVPRPIFLRCFRFRLPCKHN